MKNQQYQVTIVNTDDDVITLSSVNVADPRALPIDRIRRVQLGLSSLVISIDSTTTSNNGDVKGAERVAAIEALWQEECRDGTIVQTMCVSR